MWVFVILGFLFGTLLAPTIMKLSQYLGLSLYNRKGLDELTKQYLGANYDLTNILQDDLFIATFDYNSMTPRFYSKYFAKKSPGVYNLKINEAAAASASAPVAFSPLIKENKFGITEAFIDGGIICNNPSLYAFITAS